MPYSLTVSTQQSPSVCRLMEYDKEIYCKKKEAQKNKMTSKSLPMKEVKVTRRNKPFHLPACHS